MRPPPTATLFPYTTLFRSVVGAAASPDTAEGIRQCCGGGTSLFLSLFVLLPTLAGVLLRVAFGAERVARLRDRKSTRLNSSHLGISYAVFCLKKKRTSESQ